MEELLKKIKEEYQDTTEMTSDDPLYNYLVGWNDGLETAEQIIKQLTKKNG